MKTRFLKLTFLLALSGLLFPLPAFGQEVSEETTSPSVLKEESLEEPTPDLPQEPPAEGGQKKTKNLRILYEGSLTDEEGATVPDGQYNIRFTIWSEKEGGEILWRESYVFYNGLEIKNGLLKCVLGREVPLSLNLNKAPFFLAIEIGEETEAGLSWSGALGPRKEITTLSALLGEKELNEETWAEVEMLLEEKMAEEGDVVVLMDMGLLGVEEEEGDGQITTVLKKFIDFLSRRVSEINEKLSSVIKKLEEISSMLSDMKKKIDALYAAIVGAPSKETPSEPNATSTPPVIVEEVVEPVNPEEAGLEPIDKGSAVIQEGEEVVKIISSVIKSDSKVFVTFLENPTTSWWVSQKKEGEFFVISLHTPAEKNLELDYWIVEGSDISGSEGSQVSEECVASQEVCDGKDNDCDGEVDEKGVCTPGSSPPSQKEPASSGTDNASSTETDNASSTETETSNASTTESVSG